MIWRCMNHDYGGRTNLCVEYERCIGSVSFPGTELLIVPMLHCYAFILNFLLAQSCSINCSTSIWLKKLYLSITSMYHNVRWRTVVFLLLFVSRWLCNMFRLFPLEQASLYIFEPAIMFISYCHIVAMLYQQN